MAQSLAQSGRRSASAGMEVSSKQKAQADFSLEGLGAGRYQKVGRVHIFHRNKLLPAFVPQGVVLTEFSGSQKLSLPLILVI